MIVELTRAGCRTIVASIEWGLEKGAKMASREQISTWLAEANAAIASQPASTWTVARMRLAYPRPGSSSWVQIDAAAAAGACPAAARPAVFNESLQRVEIQAIFSSFELRGRSPVIGPFRILLQRGRQAEGRFRQQYANSLWPIQGAWTVPFLIETPLGHLIPRPTDEPVTLKSAAPGEFAIPPIGRMVRKMGSDRFGYGNRSRRPNHRGLRRGHALHAKRG
jgi:hypothetical protein